MVQPDGLVIHPLPKHSWPARQKENLDKPGATDKVAGLASELSRQVQASPSPHGRSRQFQHLLDSLQRIHTQPEFNGHLSTLRDIKMGDSPVGSKPRHRTVAVSYDAQSISHGNGSLFPLDTPVPTIEDLRSKRTEAAVQSSFLLIGDGSSRVFRGSGIPTVLQRTLDALGVDNLALLDPMKSFQTSSYNHVGCPLGLLSHLTFIYQCEIRENAKVTLSVVWVKTVDDEDEGYSSPEGSNTSKKYCRAPIETFDLNDTRQTARLLAWLRSISAWALKERFEALRVAQQLDEVRQRRFQQANISLLQEFGADLSTAWLSGNMLNGIPSPSAVQHHFTWSIRSTSSTSGSRSRTKAPPQDEKIEKKQRSLTPPPPPTLAWQSLLPSHKLEGFPKAFGVSPATKSTISLPVHLASDTKKPDLARRLSIMAKMYDSFLRSPGNGQAKPEMPLRQVVSAS
jgi:hypothetical protein